MNRTRFELALRELGPGQWERFEQLASQFLADDLDDLRTMASPSGDRGRDAELFTGEDPTALVQYSVASDRWHQLAMSMPLGKDCLEAAGKCPSLSAGMKKYMDWMERHRLTWAHALVTRSEERCLMRGIWARDEADLDCLRGETRPELLRAVGAQL